MHARSSYSLLLVVLAATACSRTDVFAGPSATLTVAPATAEVELGRSLQFSATTLPENLAVRWSLEPADAGTLSATGIFTAPGRLPEGADHLDVVVHAALLSLPDITAQAHVRVVPSATGPAIRLTKLSGDAQTVPAGATAPEALVAKAEDAAGNGVAGVALTFATPDQDPVVGITDASGVASTPVRARTAAGAMEIVASAEGLEPVTFALQIVPGPLARLVATHPTSVGHPGAPLTGPVSLRFTDGYDNPLPGQTASAQPPGGASAKPLAASSDAAGLLSYALTLADTIGVQSFSFSADADPSVTAKLDVTAEGGPAASLTLLDGDGQDGTVGQPLSHDLRVQLLDSAGFPASSANLVWSTPDGGQIENTSAAPDASGIAAARLVLPTHAGLVRVICTADGATGSPITFIAKANAGTAQRLQLVGGAGQTATAGGAFGTAFSIRATDAFSNGVPGVQVTFEVVAGGGGIAPALVSTGADGLAQAAMTAGTTGTQRFRARATGLLGSPIDIIGTAVAPTSMAVAIVSGQAQAGSVATDLPQPLVVRVTQNGAPVAGQTVTFGVAVGDGSVRPSSSVTASDGLARTTARLGSQPGSQRFSASVAGATNSPVFFDATASARPPALLRLVSGAGQIGAPGASLGAPFVVEALDVMGAGVPGQIVHFAAPAGGSVAPADVTTDTSGRAAALGTLAAVGGDQVFTATLDGGVVPAIAIHATASSAANLRRLQVTGGNAQTAEVGLPLAQPLEVQLLGPDSAPVAGAQIRFRAEADLALVSPGAVLTDSNGRAQVKATLGRTTGTQRFFAETDDAVGSPATIVATATAAPADRLVVASGDGQSGGVRASLPRPLVVRATDRVGNVKSGISVTVRAGVGGGACTPSSGTTDANGEFTFTATLGPAAGPQTFVAESTGLTPATFTALATNPVDRISISPQGLHLEPGASVRYTATAIYSDGTSSEVTADATWVSSSASVLGVSDQAGSKGVALATAAGSATISATYGGKTGSTLATVEAATLRTIVILPALPRVVKGSTLAFRATGTYSNGDVVDVTETAGWSSSAPAVASVSDTAGSKGAVRGVSVGSATITATAQNVSGTRQATVTQAPLRQLEVTPPDISQPAGTGYTFRATATYADGTVEDVTRSATWSSSDTTLMTVQNVPAEPGRATFLAPGTPSVKATWQGTTAAQPVTITAATVVSLAMFPRQVTLAVRDIFQPRLIATYSDGSVSDVADLASWSSSAAAVVDVSNAAGSRGLVTALSAGSASITARLGSVSAALAVAVNNASVQGIRVVAQGRGATCPVGGVIALRAQALYSGGQPADISDQASWSVADPSLAVVGQGPLLGGVVRCLAEGRTTVTAEFAGKSGNINLTVTPATLTSISLAPTSAQLAAGDVRAFFATGHYSDGTQRELTNLVTWDSSNLAVVSVSNAVQNKGRATANAPGTANVTATYDGITGSAPVTVSTATLTLVVVTPANPVARPRDRALQFNATAVYSDGTTQDVTDRASWTASDPQVALVSADPQNMGLVLIQGTGSCVVSGTYAGRKGQTTLTVR